jgi:Cytochrome b5-like Heme/Steroid binding domain
MQIKLLAIALASFLLLGCTANPQDTAPKAGQGSAGQQSAGGAAYQQQNSSSQPSNQTLLLTMGEVAKHNSVDDCWMVIYGRALNLSSFLQYHPGGSAYLPYCGTEATAAFETKGGRGRPHSQFAVSQLDAFTIGYLGQPLGAPAPQGSGG